MATPARLRLKAQTIARSTQPALDKPVARVWVDSGVFHLDQPYDYYIPQELSEITHVGSRVQVPFNGREVEGLILERSEKPVIGGALKTITKVMSVYPVATKTSLKLLELVAQRWIANPFDIAKSAIPPRVASVDKKIFGELNQVDSTNRTRGIHSFIAFDPIIPASIQLGALASRALRSGSVLIIAPDESDIDSICEDLEERDLPFIRLDSSQSRAIRYENYLRAMRIKKTIVIGARGAVFTPVQDLSMILVFKEGSYEHYEKRNPGWNVRDIVSMRRSLENIDLIFTGYVPSLELSALIDSKRLTYINHSHRLNIKAFSSDDGALLPGNIFTDIRKALAKGPVLFLVPRRGYGNALLCAHCRNLALCSCGSRLVVSSRGAAPSCMICNSNYPEWLCSYCKRSKQYLAGRGIERAAEEISRAFSGFPLILSFGDVIKTRVEPAPSLVLSTPGAVPKVEGGYTAVVVLEGLRFFSHPDLRAQERARELFFETSAMLHAKGVALLCIEQSHPIVSSLIRWNPGAMIRSELVERVEIALPPTITSFVITGPVGEFSTLTSGIRKAIGDKRLAASVKIYGPNELADSRAKLVMYCNTKDTNSVTTFLHELARRRSIAKKEYLSIRINPYSL